MRKGIQQRLIERLEAGRLMSCCSDPPPPPDLGPAADASMEVARVNQETQQQQLAWAREQDTMNRQTLDRVLAVQLPAAEEQASNAREDRSRYENTFRPLEDKFIDEAQNYDTPDRRAAESGRAMADVGTAFDATRRNALQRLESYGVDPSQTRNAALDMGVRVQEAAAKAAAGTNAARQVENTGRALRSDAINLGRGLPSQVAGSYAGASGTGAQAVGGANQTTGTSASAAGAAGQFGALALQGYGGAANIRSSGFQNEMQNWQAGQDQTMGWVNAASGIAGMAMMADGGKVEEKGIEYAPGHELLPRDGAIPFTSDGRVDTGMGDGSGVDDTVPAMVSDGEYVIPADVVRVKGTEFFDRLVEKYHKPAAQQRQEAA